MYGRWFLLLLYYSSSSTTTSSKSVLYIFAFNTVPSSKVKVSSGIAVVNCANFCKPISISLLVLSQTTSNDISHLNSVPT